MFPTLLWPLGKSLILDLFQWLKPRTIDFEPKYKKKGKSKGEKLVQRKKGVIEERKRDQIKEIVREKEVAHNQRKKQNKEYDIFSRFAAKSD